MLNMPKASLYLPFGLKKRLLKPPHLKSLDRSRVWFTRTCLQTPCRVQQHRVCLLRAAREKGLEKGLHMGQQQQPPASQHTFSQPGEYQAREDQKQPKIQQGLGALNIGNSFILNNQVQTNSGYIGAHKTRSTETGHDKSRHLAHNSDYPLLSARSPNLL